MKYGGNIVVCQPGTTDVAKPNENPSDDRFIVKTNNAAKTKNGISDRFMKCLFSRLSENF
jgi:hypothetical protein